MTEQQKKFAREYVKSGNVYKAAKAAGYSESYSKSNAYRLIERAEVKGYIDSLIAKSEAEDIASAQEVLKYLTRVMRGKEKESVVVATMEGVETVKKPVGAKERIKSAELLGKRYAIFTDNVDIGGGNVIIIDDIGDEGNGSG